MNFTDLNEEKIPKDLMVLINAYTKIRNKGDNCVKEFIEILSCAVTEHKLWFMENIPHFSGEIKKINELFEEAKDNNLFSRIGKIFEKEASKWILYEKERNLIQNLASSQEEVIKGQADLIEMINILTSMLHYIKYFGITIGTITLGSILYFTKQSQHILDKIYNISGAIHNLNDATLTIASTILEYSNMGGIMTGFVENMKCNQNSLTQQLSSTLPSSLPQPEINKVSNFALAGLALCSASFFYGSWRFYQSQRNLENQRNNLQQKNNLLAQNKFFTFSDDTENLDSLIEPLTTALKKK